MIPAIQIVLTSTLTGDRREIQQVLSQMENIFGVEPVDFIKDKIYSLPNLSYGFYDIDLKSLSTKYLKSNITGKWEGVSDQYSDKVYYFYDTDIVTVHSTTNNSVIMKGFYDIYSDGSITYAMKPFLNQAGNLIPVNDPSAIWKDTGQLAQNGELRIDINKGSRDGYSWFGRKTSTVSSTSETISAPQEVKVNYSFIESYAKNLVYSINTSIPACENLANLIIQMSRSGEEDYIAQRKIDFIFDKIPDTCIN